MQRREPTFDGSSSSSMDPQIPNGPAGGRQRYNAPQPTAAAPAEESSSGGGSSFLAIVALLLALAGLGGAGFLYNQWQQTRVELVDAEARIVQLEKRFEMSGEESAASVEVLNAKVKENASEIRKLWGVSYDTNRKGIAANTATAASTKKQVDALSKKVSGFESSLKKVAALESEITKLKESTVSASRDTKDKVASLERQLSSVRADLTARVGANEEAVQSIDSYRRTVNKDLVQLRDAIRSLQSSSSTASAP
ncbi:hypothetical protein [Microbulbifer hydrolyticus]|uniref:Chromosome segregation ATPase n=1 Tax=Microbulbifer hydrolyticus TaxID=48074 RepID=A0A6P1TA88_9GAMM|nr:hypothetical protein [Microbulbifer hydrolyticus]MBB5213127.1 chromosome segregation ATPase [Microbulbifer hydrolyticus]QHQ38665.1 hypothetical protein GTQ55_06460 [Microbulbifer hydrolyticus]